MADAGSWFRDNIGTLFGAESTDERAAEQQLDDAQGIWDQLGNYAPSQSDLMGISPAFGGGMDDAWFQDWIQSSGYDGSSDGQASMYSPTSRTGDPRNGGTTLRDTSSATQVNPYGTAQNKGGDMWMGGGAYSGPSAADPAGDWAVETAHYGMDADGNYIQGSAGGSDPSMSGQRMPEGDLRQMAADAWMQEQMRSDPYFGLDQLGDSQMGGAHADQGAVDAQNHSLAGLRSIYEQGGYTEEERGQNRLAQQDASRYEQSQRAAAQQQAAARGMNQSGAAMMGALSAQQGGANRAADSATQFGIAGQQRALQALMNYGNQAGQMRGQSWTEDSGRRGALDQWNAARSDQRNNWTQYRGQQAQQGFQNQAQIAAGRTGQLNTGAQYYGQQAQQGSPLWNTAVSIQQAAKPAGSPEDED
jgi:hypothetical protein